MPTDERPPKPPPRDSEKTFPDALRDVMAYYEISYRALQRATGRFRDPPYSMAHIQHLLKQETRPTPEAMSIYARAIGVSPTYFKEMREHLAAEEAVRVMRRVGLDKTLSKLRELDHS